MEKVLIIGCPGSGKSTFARQLHSTTHLPLYHLDLLYWNADKTIVPHVLFLRQLQTILSGDQWILDGNYSSTLEMRLQACDTVFFLDYSTQICLEGIEARKGIPRPDMPWVEDMYDEEFISLIRNYNSVNRPAVLTLLEQYPEKTCFRFHNREDAIRFLNSLPQPE